MKQLLLSIFILLVLFVSIAISTLCYAGTVSLAWDTYTDKSATTINVYQATDSALTTSKKVVSVASTVSSASVSNVLAGKYFYYVTASNGVIESAKSNVVEVDMPLAPPNAVVVTFTITK